MVKLILLPDLNDPTCKRMAHDPLCSRLLPMKSDVRVLICQDGRSTDDWTDCQEEANYFNSLYHDFYKLNCPNTQVQCLGLSLGSPPDELQEHLVELETCDIFYMTGFSPGQGMSSLLRQVFQNHERLGHDERDQSSAVENVFRAIVNRVQ